MSPGMRAGTATSLFLPQLMPIIETHVSCSVLIKQVIGGGGEFMMSSLKTSLVACR